ncbi:carbohydrate kinase family protein [Mesorhizobium sp. B2-6-5]|uniref:carbohydrate kinase family protein n=1 Tax=Mesorhizobium sp. B2-6-5 TaxID=2589912 RepID=UPI00112DF65F|nr:carbohydrate kinase family protein [Mesorhizobium sp. B2-6-5]TPJ32931.1 carbohydrate kinase family protein [Mesorhizobium sp. B2-6-5]
MTAATALFVGDVSLDLTLVIDHVPAPDEKVHVTSSCELAGGVVANAAVACARAGASTRMLMQTGDDAGSRFVRTSLERVGVQVESEKVGGRTCQVVILLEPHGEKRLLLDPGVSMYPSVAQIEAVDLAGVAWIHTAVYGTAASRLVERCRATGIPWSVDLEPASFATDVASLADVIAGAAVVFCNEQAARRIGTAPAATLLAMGVGAVVLTLGSRGVRLVERGGADTPIESPVRPVVRDTTGAGDCLAGWFIAQRLRGCSAVESLPSAVLAAALSCEHPGAQASYPTPETLRAFAARAEPSRLHEQHED